MSEVEAAPPAYEFDESFQEKIAALALRDTIFAQRTEGLIDPSYITNAVAATLVALTQEHFVKYRTLPSMKVFPTIIAEARLSKRIRPELVPEVKGVLGRLLRADLSDRSFVIDKVSEFARNQAMERALINSVHHLEKRDFAKIKEEMAKAELVGAADEDPAYDYFKEIDTRTVRRVAIAAGKMLRDGISTGYPEIDKYLYHHGWGRRELSLLLGAAKAGKSIGLWDMAKNATFIENDRGRKNNVLGLTCEVSKEILGDRIDANISDTLMSALHTSPHDVRDKIRMAEGKAGVFLIHEYASGTLTPSMIRRLIERYRSRGIIFDLVVVDYLDIMAPDHFTDSNIENSKQIFLGARAIGHEFDCAILSASQLNRGGALAMTGKATDIAEDYNRIRIADVAISINAKDEEKTISEARLYWAASRNTEEGFTIRIRQDRARMKFITRVIGKE